MSVQADIWAGWGVPIQAGEKLIDERRGEVKHRLMPLNADQAIDAARLLGIPFFSAHTPTDNLVYAYLDRGTSPERRAADHRGRAPAALRDPRVPHRRRSGRPVPRSPTVPPTSAPARCTST